MTDLTDQIINLIDGKENTMTDIATAPCSIYDSTDSITMVESNPFLTLRNIIGNEDFTTTPQVVINAATRLGWYVRNMQDRIIERDNDTAERLAASNRGEEIGAERERERIREALISSINLADWDTAAVNDLLTTLGMAPMTYTYRVRVLYTGGWYSRTEVASFTITTTEDMDEGVLTERIEEAISLDSPEVYVPLSINLSADALGEGSQRVEVYEDVDVAFDVSDMYSDFEVEVTLA